MKSWMLAGAALSAVALVPAEADAQGRRTARQPSAVQRQLNRAMALIQQQQQQIDRQAADLAALHQQLDRQALATAAAPIAPTAATPPLPAVAAAQGAAPGGGDLGGVVQAPAPTQLERVGQAPAEQDRPIELAVLETNGSVVTRRGQLTQETQFDYARSDRARTVFRGVSVLETLLIGQFDINESRQDVLSSSLGLRYGLTNRLEVGVRVPFVHRSDASIITPVRVTASGQPADSIDNSVKGGNIGDVELTARYQLLDGGANSPYLIANLQGVLPTGTDPFAVRRDSIGRALQVATGSGFYGISPSVTAILPSDPVVLFGTVGYTFNLAQHVDTTISPVRITYVDPGDAISGSAGIGISFNQRTTLNLGYAHSWAFGTTTRTQLMQNGVLAGPTDNKTRDLQLGRFLFGVTYRINDRSSLNWSVEVGTTEDATDLRTVLRIPTVLLTGR